MSLIMMTCNLCNKRFAWDSIYEKITYIPIHYCETTAGLTLCDGERQWRPIEAKEMKE